MPVAGCLAAALPRPCEAETSHAQPARDFICVSGQGSGALGSMPPEVRECLTYNEADHHGESSREIISRACFAHERRPLRRRVAVYVYTGVCQYYVISSGGVVGAFTPPLFEEPNHVNNNRCK